MALHLRGRFLPDETERDLWLVDGRISYSPPARSSAVDTVSSGGWVIPGLVDVHCHIGLSKWGHVTDPAGLADQARLNLDAGVLLMRDVGSPVDSRSVQAREDLPHLIRAGRHIARTKRYIRDQGVEVEPEDLVAEVERQAAASDGWVKLAADWIDRSTGDLGPTFPDDAIAAAVARAHELGARVAAHVFGREALPGLLAAGIDSIEHGIGLTDDLIEMAVASGAALVPTLVNTDNLPEIARQAESKFPTYANHMRQLFASSRQRVRSAWEAGLPIYVGTDAGGLQPHGSILAEVRALISCGIPQGDVVAAASWKAREWLGFPTFEEGALADLMVFDSDPRRYEETLARPSRVVLKGKVVA